MNELKQTIASLFRDWYNNFLTVERFAAYYDIDESRALRLITIGRTLHNRGY